MLSTTELVTLTRMFRSEFGRDFTEMNAAVIPAALNDNNCFERPVTKVVPGTVQVLTLGAPADAAIVPKPARCYVTMQETPALEVQYKIVIQEDELRYALGSESYFRTLMTPLMRSAYTTWMQAVGSHTDTRYGVCFISDTDPRAEAADTCFKSINDDYAELTLFGLFAGEAT